MRARAVEAGYPFYGTIATQPAGAWARLLPEGGAIVDPTLLATLADRNEVDDRVAAGRGGAQAPGVRDVPSHELGAPGREPRGLPRVTDETAHRQAAAAELVDDVATDEPRAPGDEDQFAGSFRKFCQYREGVGPRWPWYLERVSALP